MNKKILYLDWPCFGKEDILETFSLFGYDVIPFFHESYTERVNPDFDKAFDTITEEHDFYFCFSFNYYPLVSEGCKRCNIPYISIIYDSPYVAVYSYTIINPNNYVFIFDSDLYFRLHDEGIQTVYYLPLSVNAGRMKRIFKASPIQQKEYQHEVSFIGSLYYEDHNFFERLTGVSDYTRGYLDAIMKAQQKVYGFNFIEQVLKKDILSDMAQAVPYGTDPYGVQSLEYIYGTYFIDRKITQTERLALLNTVSERFALSLFTRDSNAPIPHARNYGTADYYKDMPHIFRSSKINLNITLRSITSGIPLRGMDIMGCGGFLLTNYQSDFLRHFIPGEDFAYFESRDDLLEKADYYLTHNAERKEIAENGYQKTLAEHSYEVTLLQILALVFPDSSS